MNEVRRASKLLKTRSFEYHGHAQPRAVQPSLLDMPDLSQTSDRLDSPYAAEVRRLHEVIAGWTTGALTNSDEVFAGFARALAPGFVIVNPEGIAEDRDTVVPRFRGLYGKRAGRDFRIEIHESVVHRVSDGLALVTYHEHWFESAAEGSVIIATALLEPNPDAPGALAWRHLHETWLRPPLVAL